MARPQRPVREKQGLYVAVRNNDVSRALRKLKRLLQDEGMILEMRKRKYYVKPSEKRAKAKAAGRARWLKKQRELELR
jgi:small subunit ribosomal protein S21